MDVIPGGRRESSGSFRPVTSFIPVGEAKGGRCGGLAFPNTPPPSFSVLTGRGKKKKTRIGEISPSKIKLLFSLAVLSTFLRSYKFRKLTDPRTGRGNGSYTRNIFITRIRFDPRYDGISLRLLGKIFTIGISSLDVRRKRGLFGELHLG